MANPWKRLSKLAHIDLIWHQAGPMGLTDHDAGIVSLRRDLTRAQRRSTLAHELLHVQRGPTLDDAVLVEREELRVEKESARWLLPDVRAIGEALAWAYDLDEAADELDVDARTLWVRLAHLHPAERGYLRGRLDAAEKELV